MPAAGGASDPWGPPPPHPQPLRDAMIDGGWMAGAAALDLGTTRYCLDHSPTCREGNPFMQSTGSALAFKAGATVAGGWACYALRKRGHPRGAKWLRWGIVAVWSGAAINNVLRARAR